MKLAVDCRYMGRSGIGRVCQGIVDNLHYDKDEIYLVGDPEKLKDYTKAKIIEDYTDPYSINGLLSFNKKFINKHCQALIVPNFLVPCGITIPIHSVMHDLIFLDIKQTVNGKADYFIKKFLLKRGLKRSKSVACVSRFTLDRVNFHFKKYVKKCYVNYNGLSKEIIEYEKQGKNIEKTNTIIFVGNVKRHKGLDTLLEAYKAVNDKFKLKIIGEREGFLTGLEIDESKYNGVEFTGKLTSEKLYDEIKAARYLVQPSVYEGFGLPPLEAMYLGTQPIISKIPVFEEIYNGLPVKFFDDVEDLSRLLTTAPDSFDCRQKLIEQFSFDKFVQAILSHID
jgi:glycosyltransferase involved in cell wall biosynthesis